MGVVAGRDAETRAGNGDQGGPGQRRPRLQRRGREEGPGAKIAAGGPEGGRVQLVILPFNFHGDWEVQVESWRGAWPGLAVPVARVAA